MFLELRKKHYGKNHFNRNYQPFKQVSQAILLVYAHNTDSKYHEKAAAFIEKVMNERNDEGKLKTF